MIDFNKFLNSKLQLNEDTPMIQLSPDLFLYDGDYAVSYSQELGRPVEDRNCFKGAKGHAFAGFRLDKNRLESFLVFRPVEARFNGVYYKVNPKNLFFPEPGDDV